MIQLTRRTILTGAAAATTIAAVRQPALAAAPPTGKQAPGFYRYKLGEYEITVVTDGVNRFKLPDNFVTNVKREDVNAALAAAYLEPDMMAVPYSPIVVNTGSRLIVIDTSTGEANFAQSKGAGWTVPGQSRGGRHRCEGGRYGHHFPLSRRPREWTSEGGQYARLPQRRDSGPCGGAQILDGRRRDESRARRPHGRIVQEQSSGIQRRSRQAAEDL